MLRSRRQAKTREDAEEARRQAEPGEGVGQVVVGDVENRLAALRQATRDRGRILVDREGRRISRCRKAAIATGSRVNHWFRVGSSFGVKRLRVSGSRMRPVIVTRP